MRDLIQIKVECYAGFKANEYPRSFYLDNNRVDIEEVIDRWYQISAPGDQYSSTPEHPPANYFKVRSADGKIYILKYEILTGNWFLWIKGESINLH